MSQQRLAFGWRLVVAISALLGAINIQPAIGAEQPISFEFMKLSPEVFEHTIDYMVTINLGLFALVGYSLAQLSPPLKTHHKLLTYATMLIFCAFGVASFIFAYFARMWLAGRLSVGLFDYEATYTYVLQAITLLFAGATAFVFCAIAMLHRPRHNIAS